MKIGGVFFLFSVSLLEATVIKVLPYEKVSIYQRQDPSLVLLQQSALQTGSQQDRFNLKFHSLSSHTGAKTGL